MPFNGSGTFVPAVTFVDNTTATAEDQNTQDNDIAGGLTACMTRAGLAAATANQNFGGFRLTDIANGIASTDAVSLSQLMAATDSWCGATAGSANAQTATAPNFTSVTGQKVSFTASYTNTAACTFNAIQIFKASAGGPVSLTGGEITIGNDYLLEYRSSLSGGGGWMLIGPTLSPTLTSLGISSDVATALTSGSASQCYIDLGGVPAIPAGRLTLTTATPVLSTAVLAATTIIYTPYLGNNVPVWNGTVFGNASFSEINQALSDTTNSPAAAIAGSVYDMFVWSKSGVITLSRGPVWSSSTARALALNFTKGFYVNASSITNGPAAGYGVYVGTIATDAGGATVTFNPIPSAASGGPTNGAWVGIWNQYNSVPIFAAEQDSKVSWTPTASWGSADASANNRITFVSGQPQAGVSATYFVQIYSLNASNYAYSGIGFDSTTSPSVAGTVQTGSGASGGNSTVSINLSLNPQTGKHYIQALEIAGSGSPVIYGGSGGMQLSAQLWY